MSTAKLKTGTSLTTATVKGAKGAAAAVMVMVEKALQGARNMVQTIEKLEPLLSDAANACLKHCHDHGDATLADKLVKGLPAHPSMVALRSELVAWFRVNSPIRWKADGSVHVLKEGDDGYKPFDEEKASDTAFYETKQAKGARDAAAKAHKAKMEPLTFKDVLMRVKGLRRTVQAATEKDKNGEVRGIAKGDKTKILGLLASIDAVLPDASEEVKAA